MIDNNELRTFVDKELADSGCYLTDLEISADNRIRVEIDSDSPVDIDRCIELTRAIEGAFDRDKEDYELEVGSAGLTSPLRVPRQYSKYIGRDLEVLTSDGRKLHGVLRSADGDGIGLEIEEKVRQEGAKRPVAVRRTVDIPYAGIRRAVYDLKF